MTTATSRKAEKARDRVAHAGDRANRVVGAVPSRVPDDREARSDGDLGSLTVTDFTDQRQRRGPDEEWQRRPAAKVRSHLAVHLRLADTSMAYLNRVLDREDIAAAVIELARRHKAWSSCCRQSDRSP